MARIQLQVGELAETEAEAIAVDVAGSPAGRDLPDGAAAAEPGALRCRLRIDAAPPRAGEVEAALRSTARRCLELAAAGGARTLALPALGRGVPGLTLVRCAQVLLEEARRSASLDEVRFVLRDEPELRVFEQVNDAERVREGLAKLGRRAP